jgi:mannose-6-phosphate isomerase class I
MTLNTSTETYNPYPNDLEALRNTDQLLMQPTAEGNFSNGYEIYPAFKIDGVIHRGYDSLVNYLLASGGNFIFEGYGGVQWDAVKNSVNGLLNTKNIAINWFDIETCLKPEHEIDSLISSSLGGDDPLFGKIYPGIIADFFDDVKLSQLVAQNDGVNIVYGCGAGLVNWPARVVYFEVPKNEIQFRSRAGNVKNLGATEPTEAKSQYKRFYFIDWEVFNKHKQALLPLVDVWIDEQRRDDITWMKGPDLLNAFSNITSTVFRPRPWFEPGVWGGQWIKDNIAGLNKDVVNYAWSFELIAPENGVVFENNGLRFEISIDTLLYYDNQAVLGKAAKRFGYKYPIRFDFLDTMNGDNLSLQCHPSVAYTKQHFGEDFTQDETYYILEAGADAKVYLGFQENIYPEKFKNVLENSFENNLPVAVENYVQVFPAQKHDLFLIPNGTVHCSGTNNLVLEISATPYIFTFKMYDWLRPDLNGNPRTLNIDRAFDNLDFTRKGQVVTDTLISKQTIIKQGPDWQIINLNTHPDHFYAVQRMEFDLLITDVTDDQCLVLSLVEGSSILVKTGDREQVIQYAETFIIPASAGTYQLKNIGKQRAKVIKAFVKDDHCL